MINKTYITYNEYAGLVQEICRQIQQDRWRPDYVVGITRGGLWPATMISHYLDIPMHTLKVTLRDHQDTESNLWMAEDAFGAVSVDDQTTLGSRWDPSYRKKILVVDDINDSGATINWILEDWSSSCYPKENTIWDNIWNNNVKFATVIDNLKSKAKIKVDYTGKEMDKQDNDWIVFPYEEWWR